MNDLVLRRLPLAVFLWRISNIASERTIWTVSLHGNHGLLRVIHCT
jgi:hypothetical protein